jgi:acetoin utilization deacetylase AcuC-like enzyme
MRFCLFNNVAIAASHAKATHGLKRILIVDWDLHHGNGTQQAFYYSDPSILFFSSHQYPYYPGTGDFHEIGSGKGEGFTVNAPFPRGFGSLTEIVKNIADCACSGKIILSLEGGYNLDGLQDGVRSVLNVLQGQPSADIKNAPAKRADEVIETMIRTHAKYWKSVA